MGLHSQHTVSPFNKVLSEWELRSKEMHDPNHSPPRRLQAASGIQRVLVSSQRPQSLESLFTQSGHSDLLKAVLSHLDAWDLYNCVLTSHHIRQTIVNSSTLQLILRYAIHGAPCTAHFSHHPPGDKLRAFMNIESDVPSLTVHEARSTSIEASRWSTLSPSHALTSRYPSRLPVLEHRPEQHILNTPKDWEAVPLDRLAKDVTRSRYPNQVISGRYDDKVQSRMIIPYSNLLIQITRSPTSNIGPPSGSIFRIDFYLLDPDPSHDLTDTKRKEWYPVPHPDAFHDYIEVGPFAIDDDDETDLHEYHKVEVFATPSDSEDNSEDNDRIVFSVGPTEGLPCNWLGVYDWRLGAFFGQVQSGVQCPQIHSGDLINGRYLITVGADVLPQPTIERMAGSDWSHAPVGQPAFIVFRIGQQPSMTQERRWTLDDIPKCVNVGVFVLPTEYEEMYTSKIDRPASWYFNMDYAEIDTRPCIAHDGSDLGALMCITFGGSVYKNNDILWRPTYCSAAISLPMISKLYDDRPYVLHSEEWKDAALFDFTRQEETFTTVAGWKMVTLKMFKSLLDVDEIITQVQVRVDLENGEIEEKTVGIVKRRGVLTVRDFHPYAALHQMPLMDRAIGSLPGENVHALSQGVPHSTLTPEEGPSTRFKSKSAIWTEIPCAPAPPKLDSIAQREKGGKDTFLPHKKWMADVEIDVEVGPGVDVGSGVTNILFDGNKLVVCQRTRMDVLYFW